MNKHIKLTALAFAASLAFSATSAHATNGVLEINQACVNAPNGCFAGDSQGFPVTITKAGSYRLTSNLQKPDGSPAVDGIVVTGATTSANIDLNGFTLSKFERGIDILNGNATVINGMIELCFDGVRVSNGGATVYIANVSFEANSKAGVYVENGQVTVDNIRANRNETGVWRKETGERDPYLIVKNSTFMNNRKVGVGYGFCTNNTFIGNQANTPNAAPATQLQCADPSKSNLCAQDNNGPWLMCGL